jgi:hypothetical protein
MSAAKLTKTKPKSGLSPLSPEAETALKAQVEMVAAALKAGRDLETLKSLVTAGLGDPLWDQHLMLALARLRHQAIPALLAALFGAASDKARRKALMRALHLLKTQGLPVPPELLPREEPVVGRAKPLETKALLSAVQGNGDSVIVLEAPKEVLGGNFLVAVSNDVAGLLECHLLNMKSRQQEEFWEHYRQQGVANWYPVPGPLAVRLLEESYGKDTTATPAKRTYSGLRERIWQNWGRPDAVPDLKELLPPVEPGEHSRLLEQSRLLAAQPLFMTWLPGPEELPTWVERLKEVQESPLVLSDQQKQVRVDALFDEATRALYPPESRPLWGRRLLLMAYCLEQAGQLEDSKMARAAAEDLSDSERRAMAGENPFLKSLVQAGLRLAWEMAAKSKEAQSQSGLLTLPGEPQLLRR